MAKKNQLSEYIYFKIIGEPSQNEMKNMAETEKARVEKQQQDLGEKGLKQKEEQLKKANEENEVSYTYIYVSVKLDI